MELKEALRVPTHSEVPLHMYFRKMNDAGRQAAHKKQ
jgi:hypothetical protein